MYSVNTRNWISFYHPKSIIDCHGESVKVCPRCESLDVKLLRNGRQNEKNQKHVIAFYTNGWQEWVVDLHRYGVRPNWTKQSIRIVANREMKKHWNKPCDGWVIQ